MFRSLLSGGAFVLLLVTTATAQAQTDTTPPPPSSSPPPAATASSAGGGGEGIGVGASAWITGLTGAEIVYDTSMWHIAGLIGFSSASAGANTRRTDVEIGVSGWYHLHRGSSSDFSVGGGIAFADASAGGTSAQAFVIEPGLLARIFPVSNVAVFARAGLAMVFGDNGTAAGGSSSVALSGQVTGAFGFTYFFH